MRCDRCAIAHLGQNGLCPVFQEDMNGQKGCPMFAERLIPCAICGGHIMGQPILELDKEGNYHKLCVSCSQKSQCDICFCFNRCDFNNSRIHPELQPFVIQVVRQGPMTMQTQAPNAKRIEVVCKNCKCYNPDDKENYCRKNKLKCDNYDPKWRD